MIKAIETEYKGYNFRSRLEARWAVFFDAMGYDWEYEVEGFELSDGQWYLPDFKIKLSVGTLWVEVKPSHVERDGKFEAFKSSFDEDDEYKVFFALVSGDPVDFMMNGDAKGLNIDAFMRTGNLCPCCGVINWGVVDWGAFNSSSDSYNYSCESCDWNTPGGGGNEDINLGFCDFTPHKGVNVVNVGIFNHQLQRIMLAATKARQARFEHGKTPCYH